MNRIASISDLRKNIKNEFEKVEESGPLLVINNGQKTAYVVGVKAYEALIEYVEDLEDIIESQNKLEEFKSNPNAFLSFDEALEELNK